MCWILAYFLLAWPAIRLTIRTGGQDGYTKNYPNGSRSADTRCPEAGNCSEYSTGQNQTPSLLIQELALGAVYAPFVLSINF